MDRLKDIDREIVGENAGHLHSNMDRLKVTPFGAKVNNFIIYIPIWID